ncbi:MAG: tRNA pseudouridine(38-40) synthase TruA [Chloroflexota bacterium]|nr:tRNA pseudouridine(38-40) synthase TruA [Chloroflexota bacterium]
MNKYLAVLTYDGTDFKGSQKQTNSRTVQGSFESALMSIHKEFVSTEFASRTDSGVHATNQVASFESSKELSSDLWISSINHYMPKDAKILKCIRVDKNLNFRRDALEREYVYKINFDRNSSPIENRYYEHIDYHIKTEDLSKVYELFVGVHDFLSFAGRLAPSDISSKREIKHISHVKDEKSLEFSIIGKSFLYQQVRRMIGSFLLFMKGKMTINQLSEMIDNPKKGAINFLPSSKGLYLSNIKYDGVKI